MMDIVYVTYNSEKWIESCFLSLINSNYDLKQIHVYVVDNNSSDNTVELLNRCKSVYQAKIANFDVICLNRNLGFGKANNIAFKKGSSDIVCFFNIDTELLKNTLTELEMDIANSNEEIAAWELRQFPYEHPKRYDPVTREMPWASGAAVAFRRNAFAAINGFDEHIFMYAEDVDISWRLRACGYKIRYVPKAIIKHYSYESAGEIKPNQYINSIINNLLLRYRFGGLSTIIKGHLLLWKIMLKPSAFPRARKMLLKRYLRHFIEIPHFLSFSKKHTRNFHPLFLEFDYTMNRTGAFYINELPEKNPLVSIIVRTIGRPDVLREALITIRNQTYQNIEVVVVEDGSDISRGMIESEFQDLNLLYYCTNQKVGRSAAGNIAINMSHGKYINYLDDDDLFYADHVEVLVRSLEKAKSLAAYAFGFETPIIIHSLSPYSYELTGLLKTHEKRFDRQELCYHNYIPIQCMMFEKELFDRYGGMDETLDALEDWDMWVRYAMHTDFYCVEKTTSEYRVPHSRQLDTIRQKKLDSALCVVREKHKRYEYVEKTNAFELGVHFKDR